MSDNVQLENGYTRIAHEILEQIAQIKLSPTQYRLIFVIWRYTYGFNRKTHKMPLSFLSTSTGCDKRHIQRELKDLEDRNIIIQNVISGKDREIGFNKHYKDWIGKSTYGEIDNGEIDNGKIDNGEIINATYGEIVKGAYGEIDNGNFGAGERIKKTLKKTLKKDNQSVSHKNFVNIHNKESPGQIDDRLTEIISLKNNAVEELELSEYTENLVSDTIEDLYWTGLDKFPLEVVRARLTRINTDVIKRALTKLDAAFQITDIQHKFKYFKTVVWSAIQEYCLDLCGPD